LPVCWCSLEPVDRDPTSFLDLLVCSVINRFYNLTPGLLANPKEHHTGPCRIRHIAGLLAKIGPHVIIIDDFHKALSEELWQTLNRLLKQLPAGSTILVATRNEGTLPVDDLVDGLNSDRGVVLPADELRFTSEELQKLMQKRFGRVIGSADAEEIRRVTEGIIAQILLTGHAMQSELLLGRLQQRQRLDTIYGYLTTEYLDRQPAELQRFLEAGDKVGAAEVQLWKSASLRMERQADDSLASAIASLARSESWPADERTVAWARRNPGAAQLRASHRFTTISVFSRAIEQFEAAGDKYRVGKCHQYIGNCLAAEGNIGGARHHYTQACRIWRDLRNANELSTTLNSLGTSLIIIGNHKRALQYLGESRDIATEAGLPDQYARALAGLGDVYLARHSFKLAREAYVDSIRYAELANRPALKIYNLVKLGESYYQQQDLAKALTKANWARELAAEYGAAFETGLVCAVMAKIFTRQQEYETCFDLSEEAVTSFTGNDILEQTKARLWWAFALLTDHRTATAFEQLQKAIELTHTMGQSLTGLGQTITETRQLFDHFLHWPNTPSATRNNIRRLLERTRHRFTLTGPGLQVFTLGQPYLIIAGLRKPVTPPGGRRIWLELLAYLLIEGQDGGCRWDQVCASLWPELTPVKASVTFHQAMKRLRHKVFDGVDYILVQDDYYRVNPHYLQRCDALGFEELYARLATVSAAEVLNLIPELIALYNGQFLTGFELGEWGQNRRSSYEQRYLQLIRLASKQLLTAGEPLQALVISNRGLTRDYFREDLHRSILRAYTQLGFNDQLKAHYQALQTMLREAGTAPEPATAQLYRQLTGSTN
jgi:DNA-binding SARP family transcriptional activator/tetratricopeptide (TPR) repeat protein